MINALILRIKFPQAMVKYITSILIILFCSSIEAQGQMLWKKMDANVGAETGKNANGINNPNSKKVFQLNDAFLKQLLETTETNSDKAKGAEITIPNSTGELEKYYVWESSNFEPELQAKFPEIRAYSGVGITDKTATLHFSVSPKGIETMVLRANSASEFMDPTSGESLYTLKSGANGEKGMLPLNCKTEDVVINKQLLNQTGKMASNTKIFKTLRLALSCTGEYTTYHGGTIALALAAMNATMTRVNGVFNKDLAVKLVIIGNNNLIMYTDALTDPYSDATAGAGGSWSQELQTNLTNTITNNGYDVGHLFGASGGGGNAGCIGCVCVAPTGAVPLGKGSAYTSPSDNKPEGDTFDIDFVAHEMGHQLGANHSYSYALEGTGVNVEPGSGSTIMGYAGITSDYDVQNFSDDYFAYASIKQIQDNLLTKSCPTNTVLTNSPPVIDAGLDYTIPKGTPFILKGMGSDPNGDTVTFTWEQNDSAITTDNANSLAVSSKPDGPLFRSLKPGSSATRYMPAYANVLSNKLTSKWESVATVARTLHFVLTGRDNAAAGTAQTNSDETTINVSGTAGPFAVTSQNTENLSWFKNTSQVVTWDVNGTNTLPGSANVNIKLSTDGGLTFPTTLVSNTPNDGTQTVTVPDITAKNCRILIEPTSNIYYSINRTAFSIGYSVTSSCNSYAFSAPFAIPEQAAYTTRTITVPATTASVSDVNFKVNFTHAFFSDVEMEIVSPLGTTVKLFDRNCSSASGTLDLVYDDSGVDLMCGASAFQTVLPFQPLAAFNGENPSGTWTFRIRDAYKSDTGTLNSASIALCVQTYTLSAADFEISDFVMYPNPNKGNFNIQFTSQSLNGVQVYVHDLLGRKLFEKEYKNESVFNKNIQLHNVQAGVYLLTVIDGDRKEIKKLVIQ